MDVAAGDVIADPEHVEAGIEVFLRGGVLTAKQRLVIDAPQLPRKQLEFTTEVVHRHLDHQWRDTPLDRCLVRKIGTERRNKAIALPPNGFQPRVDRHPDIVFGKGGRIGHMVHAPDLGREHALGRDDLLAAASRDQLGRHHAAIGAVVVIERHRPLRLHRPGDDIPARHDEVVGSGGKTAAADLSTMSFPVP